MNESRVKVRIAKERSKTAQPTFSSIITKNEVLRNKVDEEKEYQFEIFLKDDEEY